MFSLKTKSNRVFRFALTLSVIFGMLAFNVYPTSAYFNDNESSINNKFSAGILNIGVSGRDILGTVLPGGATTTEAVLYKSDPANLDFQYFASSTLLGADILACDYVSVSASSSLQNYSGLLKNFVSIIDTPAGLVQWDFIFTVASNVPIDTLGKVCSFKITYLAWQINITDNSDGFSDVAEISGSIRIGEPTVPTPSTVPDIVLNEFIPNPTGADTALMPEGEWVELYNNSEVSVDVGNWVIYDDTDSNELYITNLNTNTGLTVVPAHGYLVVYKNGDSDFSLNNTSDSVRLYDGYPVASHNLIDFYNYAQAKSEGFSYARIPDGVGNWVDPVPTPGEPNRMEEISGGSSTATDIAPAEITSIATTTEQIASTTSEVITETASSTEVGLLPDLDGPTIEASTTTPQTQPSTTPEIETPVNIEVTEFKEEPAIEVAEEPALELEPAIEPTPTIESAPAVETPAAEPPPNEE